MFCAYCREDTAFSKSVLWFVQNHFSHPRKSWRLKSPQLDSLVNSYFQFGNKNMNNPNLLAPYKGNSPVTDVFPSQIAKESMIRQARPLYATVRSNVCIYYSRTDVRA